MRGYTHFVKVPSEGDFGYRGFDLQPTEWHGGADDAAAKWFKHRVVYEVRREMASSATTRRHVAERLSVVENHLGKKLAGSSPVTVDDLVRLAIAFGPGVVPKVASAEDLFPPGFHPSLTT